MRKIITIILTIIAYSNIAYAQNKQLAVFVYSNSSIPTNAIRSQLISSFLNGGDRNYDIVDRTEEILSILLSEYKYQGSGMVEDEQVISIGEHLAANYICVVAITQYPDHQYFFEGKIVDVKKRQIVRNSFFPNTSEKKIYNLDVQSQLDASKKLAEQLGISYSDKYEIGSEFKTFVGDGYRVGYLDGTKKHGLAFRIIGNVSYPGPEYDISGTDIMKLEYNRREIGLAGEFWTSELARKKTKKGVCYKWYYTYRVNAAPIDTWHKRLSESEDERYYAIDIIRF